MLRKALGLIALSVASVVGVIALSDATQTRPDPPQPRHTSEVILEVRTADPKRSALRAAEGLWGVCYGTVNRQLLEPISEVGDHRFRISLQSGLGPHAQDRLKGCLQDFTMDRVKGAVERITVMPPP